MRTLRLALTSITNEEVAGASARELTDDEVVKVLTREARKRREAAEAFSAAGRSDQAAAERAEGEVLAGYLPAQLSDDELAALVDAAIAETGASGVAGLGRGPGRVAGNPSRRNHLPSIEFHALTVVAAGKPRGRDVALSRASPSRLKTRP